MPIMGQPIGRARCARGVEWVKYFSTRGDGPVTLDRALVEGIAADGGLFMPESLPAFTSTDFDGAEDLRQVARVMLAPFFAESSLESDLDGVLEAGAGRIPPRRCQHQRVQEQADRSRRGQEAGRLRQRSISGPACAWLFCFRMVGCPTVRRIS